MVGVTYNTNQSPPAVVSFIFDEASGIADLNTMLPAGSGWHISSPTGINDAGQIIGVGTLGGQQHGVLLTPALIFNPSSFKYNSGSGTVTFTVSGLNGSNVVIQASCDLMTWVPISTNTIAKNKASFTDTGASTCPTSRYYRAVVIQ